MWLEHMVFRLIMCFLLTSYFTTFLLFDQRRVVVVVMNLFHVYILHWYIIRLQGLFFPSIHGPSGEAFALFDDLFLLPMAKLFVLEKQIWQ